jgi:hypothetical protein
MPTAADLSIYEGDDWAGTVTVNQSDGTPANLTGYTAQSQIRTGPADQQPTVAAEIQATVQLPNQVLLYLSHAQTTSLSGPIFYWDCQITSSTGQITTILAGKVKVTQEITRELSSAMQMVRIA